MVEWKKILKAAFIPVAVWFLLEVTLNTLLTLAYALLTPQQYYDLTFGGGGYLVFTLVSLLLSTIIVFIYVGYSSLKGYRLGLIGALIAGILSIFFLTLSEAAVSIIFQCIISEAFVIHGGHGHLTMCETTQGIISQIYYSGLYLYSIFGIFGLIIGWIGALIAQRVKLSEVKNAFEKFKKPLLVGILLIIALFAILSYTDQANRKYLTLSAPPSTEAIYCMSGASMLKNTTAWANWHGGPPPPHAYINSNLSVYAYDINSNLIYKFASTNMNASSYKDISCNLIGDTLYCAYGAGSALGGLEVYSYKIGSDTIVRNANTSIGPNGGSGISCVSNADMLYCVNGPHPMSSGSTRDVVAYTYNTSSNELVASNSIKTMGTDYQESSRISCVYLAPNVYCLTGPFFNYKAAVYKYDTGKNQISIAKTTQEKSSSSGVSCVVFKDSMYCVTGAYTNTETRNQLKVYKYEPSSNSLDITYTTSSVGNNNPAEISCFNYKNSSIYCINENWDGKGVYAYKYEPASNSLTVLASTNSGNQLWADRSCMLLSDNIFCLTRDQSGNVYVERYSITNNTFSTGLFYDNSGELNDLQLVGSFSCVSRS